MNWELVGTGVAITLSAIVDYLLIFGYTYYKYHYRPTLAVMGYAALHITLGGIAFLIATYTDGWQWWTGGLLVFAVSLTATLYTLYHKVALWNKLVSNFKRKFSRHG